MLRGDLHIHTTASDGRLRADALVRAAKDRGLAAIAITDHETVQGWPADHDGLPRVIGGVEVAAVLDDQEFHLLGYFPGQPEIARTFLEELGEGRRRRFAKMVEKLRAVGLDVGDSIEIAPENASPGRPHLAQALVRRGAAASMAEAFDRYLVEGRPGYVPRERVPPIDVIEAVHADRGLVALAHPHKVRGEIPWARFKDWGLDAVEVYHPSADPGETAHLLGTAATYRLLVTGGSDFHDGETAVLGVPFLPEEPLLAFLSALARQTMLP